MIYLSVRRLIWLARLRDGTEPEFGLVWTIGNGSEKTLRKSRFRLILESGLAMLLQM